MNNGKTGQQSEFVDIPDYLRQFRNEKVIYYPNPGNAGDALIARATHEVFRKNRLRYEVMTHYDSVHDAVMVYGGGGNFVDYYDHCANFISHFHRRAKKLVILPHTISGHADLLGALGSNVDIFCRDDFSFAYASRAAGKANVYLAEDMALHLSIDKKKIHPLSWDSVRCFASKKIWRNSRTIGKTLFEVSRRLQRSFAVQGKRELNCFRDDAEKTDIELPVGNVDLSAILMFDFCQVIGDRNLSRLISNLLLYFLNMGDEINTNRLHHCIGAALLGKKVNFYPNSNFKNERVYVTSLKNRFPNISWHG